MKLKKFLHSIFLFILSIFINVNVVDDRFVSPLEDLSHQYQSYELEETTRLLSIHGKEQVQNYLRFSPSSAFDFSSQDKTVDDLPQRNILFHSLLLNFELLSLPPPTLV